MKIDIRPFKKLPQYDPPPALQVLANSGSDVICGTYGEFRFIVTQDTDGHTEFSLSARDKLRRIPDQVVQRFVSLIKDHPVSVFETSETNSRMRHFVMRIPRQH